MINKKKINIIIIKNNIFYILNTDTTSQLKIYLISRTRGYVVWRLTGSSQTSFLVKILYSI